MEALSLTNTVVEVSVPAIGVRESVELYVPEDDVLNSYPLGAVTVRLLARLTPLIAKLCTEEATP